MYLNPTMTKRTLDVGNCQPDFQSITTLLTNHFDCQVTQAHAAADALAELKSERYDLVLVNRKLDCDYSDGIDVIREIKADADAADTPVMLITNFPEHQDAAEAAGALRGFGKLEFDAPETLERLRAVLG